MTPMQSGNMERRVDERVETKLQVRYEALTREASDALLTSGAFSEVFSVEHLQAPLPTDESKHAWTENISVSGLKLVGDLRLVTGEPLGEGGHLLVELLIPGAPIPVRALAVIVWVTASHQDPPTREAGLFFQGIHKQDLEKVKRFMLLQKKAQLG